MAFPTGRQSTNDAMKVKGTAVFGGGGVPAGGFLDGAETAPDKETRYVSDTPQKPDPKPDPKPEQNPGLPSGTPSHGGGNILDPPQPAVSLPDFTPGTGVNGPAETTDKNGGTDQSAGSNNTKEKNATDAVSGEEIDAMMKAQGSASNDEATPGSPWWDPFGWTTGTGSTGEGPPVAVLGAAGTALVLLYLNS